MVINKLNTEFVRLYTYGKEINYLGNAIEYDDNYCTFLFFYYSRFVRVYVINGMDKKKTLVQVKSKINLINTYDGLIAKRFIRFYKEASQEPFFIKMPPLFFRELSVILQNKGYMNKAARLYAKYREDLNNGIHYPNF